MKYLTFIEKSVIIKNHAPFHTHKFMLHPGINPLMGHTFDTHGLWITVSYCVCE